MFFKQEESYENSNPDEYATSVYSAPHWMLSLENPHKRLKIRSSSTSYEKKLMIKNLDDSLPILPIQLPKANVEKKIKRKVATTKTKIKEPKPMVSRVKKKPLSRENKVSYEELVVSLFCNHCKITFYAKPTYRIKFHHTLVNHCCMGAKRRQYVLGVKRRKCVFACDRFQGCIYKIQSRIQPLAHRAAVPGGRPEL